MISAAPSSKASSCSSRSRSSGRTRCSCASPMRTMSFRAPASRAIGWSASVSSWTGSPAASPRSPPVAAEGRVALVTGAQQGIGRATAVALARAGADVALNYLDDRAATEKAASEIRAMGRRALLVQADISRAAEVDAMVAAVGQGLGVPDILVNNAGVYPRSPFLELAEREWDFVLGVNLKGSFLCAQAVARALVAAGRRGVIINIASQAIRGAPLGVHYTASKGGVVAMTRAMALALAAHG